MKAIGSLFVVAILVFISYALGLWTDRSLDWVFTYINKQPTDMPFWISWVLSILLNGLVVTFNIIVELIRFGLK